MHLRFVDTNEHVCHALESAFADLPDIEVFHGTLADAPRDWDAVVCPGNGYGIMDGGFDLAVASLLGDRVQPMVQETMRMNGAFVPMMPGNFAATGMFNHKGREVYVVYVPTMIVPMPITGTNNVYMAMRAALTAAGIVEDNPWENGPKPIETLACPGLGTETGRMRPHEAARQMRVAYDHWQRRDAPADWSHALPHFHEIMGWKHG